MIRIKELRSDIEKEIEKCYLYNAEKKIESEDFLLTCGMIISLKWVLEKIKNIGG